MLVSVWGKQVLCLLLIRISVPFEEATLLYFLELKIHVKIKHRVV